MKTLNDLIFHLDNVPLSTVPFHSDVDGLERYFSDDFPVHMAVHALNRKDMVENDYTKLHAHDVDELNIVLGTKDLQYKIGLEDEEFVVGPNTGIWIPAGIRHSSNLVKGEGYFIAIRMDMNTTDKAKNLSKSLKAAIAKA